LELGRRRAVFLTAYGFIECGEWVLSDRSRSGVDFRLHALKHERVIFAFVVNGEAKYLGICQGSEVMLRDRMDRFKNLVGGGTNERVAVEIRKLLDAGTRVKILGLDPPTMQYKGLEVDLVSGLKSSLIQRVNPAWNRRR
jgi:hypothetical protein